MKRNQIRCTGRAQKAVTASTPENDAIGNSGDLQERRPDGRFRMARSGNPAGRRPGSRNKASVILDALGDGEAREVLDVVVRRAKKGDMRAKGRSVALDLPPVNTSADAAAASAVVLAAVAEGRLTPSEARWRSSCWKACPTGR
ncbi:MAG TPA: hypothetical protein VEX11_17025 [Acetobacteraceae bacterium]|nr:hypothetical protein [Acetobacteraceae bacterium]